MKWYGSLQNRLQEHCKCPKPEIGMGATELWYSDRQAYEVIEIKDDRHITVRRLKCKLIGSYFTDCQEYEYASDPNGITANLFLTKKGQWRERHYDRSLGNVFALGFAEEFSDPSF